MLSFLEFQAVFKVIFNGRFLLEFAGIFEYFLNLGFYLIKLGLLTHLFTTNGDQSLFEIFWIKAFTH